MPPQLVVFDLDETITRHDTLLPYAMGFVLRHRPWRLPFLAGVLPSTIEFAIRRGTFANALEQIADHRRRGDHLVLMSASTDLYVPEIARALGFSETISAG